MVDYKVRERPADYKKLDLPAVSGPDDVFRLCRPMIRYKQEVFRVLLLTTRNHVFRKLNISKGSLNASLVHPRDVFRAAVRLNAAAVILVHNHPSGVPKPSKEDEAITSRIQQAGTLLGIEVLDHIIMAKAGCISMREQGTLVPT